LTPTVNADSRSFLAGLGTPAPTAHYGECHGNAAVRGKLGRVVYRRADVKACDSAAFNGQA
jgi:hypothetical protein